MYIIIHSKKRNQDFKVLLKSYRIDHAIDIASDSFEFITGNNNYEISSIISAGDFLQFYINNVLAVEGNIDDVDIEYTVSSNDIRLTGRDIIATLLDNDANPNTYNKMGLNDYMAIALPPYGINFNSTDNNKFDKITVSPGDTEYSVIEGLCGQRNLIPLYDVTNKKLLCTKPISTTNASYTFSNDMAGCLRIKDCQITISNDIKNEVIVYGGDYETNKNIKGIYSDPKLTTTKKRSILNQSDIENIADASKKAKEEFYNVNKNALSVQITTRTLNPIFSNTCIRVYIKKISFDAYLLVDSVSYTKNDTEGALTKINLKLMPGISVSFGNNDIPTLPIL